MIEFIEEVLLACLIIFKVGGIMDKIFLLSLEDVTNPEYGFCSDARKEDLARVRTNSAFVVDNPEMYPEGDRDVWWLRSPGNYSNYAMYVYYYGYVNQNGYYVHDSNFAVCPALRLNLKSSHWSYAGTVCTDGTKQEIPFTDAANVPLRNPIRTEEGSVTYHCIWFGHYPQSDATGASVEPIKWRVLEVKDGIVLLHAVQNLDIQPFNKTREDVTWDTCTLRSWLNGYGPESNICSMDYRADNFLNRAFTSVEQKAIIGPEVTPLNLF